MLTFLKISNHSQRRYTDKNKAELSVMFYKIKIDNILLL